MTKQKTKFQPHKVQRIVCPKCGELMLKVYPYSSLGLKIGNPQIPVCIKCQNEIINKQNSSLKPGVA